MEGSQQVWAVGLWEVPIQAPEHSLEGMDQVGMSPGNPVCCGLNYVFPKDMPQSSPLPLTWEHDLIWKWSLQNR